MSMSDDEPVASDSNDSDEQDVAYNSSMQESTGTAQTDIYYGGEGSPGGPNHGHIVIDEYGNEVYHRGPGED